MLSAVRCTLQGCLGTTAAGQRVSSLVVSCCSRACLSATEPAQLRFSGPCSLLSAIRIAHPRRCLKPQWTIHQEPGCIKIGGLAATGRVWRGPTWKSLCCSTCTLDSCARMGTCSGRICRFLMSRRLHSDNKWCEGRPNACMHQMSGCSKWTAYLHSGNAVEIAGHCFAHTLCFMHRL